MFVFVFFSATCDEIEIDKRDPQYASSVSGSFCLCPSVHHNIHAYICLFVFAFALTLISTKSENRNPNKNVQRSGAKFRLVTKMLRPLHVARLQL